MSVSVLQIKYRDPSTPTPASEALQAGHQDKWEMLYKEPGYDENDL
jgi:hypothetical protein